MSQKDVPLFMKGCLGVKEVREVKKLEKL